MKRLWKVVSTLSPIGIAMLVGLDITIGFFLRFSTTSKLWLDEALSVNIASGTLGQIVANLRNDGAPPLYYFLLHAWMTLFGHSDAAVRSLSGIISVLGLLAAFVLARRLWGSKHAFVATAVLAVMPYSVYFGTEARMYSLVMLESTLLLFVWLGRWEAPAFKRSIIAMFLIGMILYTHYWSIYLIGVLSLATAVAFWRSRSFNGEIKFKALAIVGGGVLWLPWLPIFNEQRLHTGTPWSPAPAFFQFLNWIEGFVVNQSRQHITPSLHHEVNLLFFIVILVLGVFAMVMKDRDLVQLDLRVPTDAKFLVVVVFGTMLLGLLASHFGHTTFVPRYASVIAVPVALLVARGIMVIDKPIRILMALLVLSGGMLWTNKWGRNVQRSQAGQVATVLAAAKPNSYVFMCPDQLGPSVLRYARNDLEFSSYPRYSKPEIVNWYDYKDAFAATSPALAGSTVMAAAENRDIYVVWSSGYTLKGTCKAVVRDIALATGRPAVRLLQARLTGFYQSMNVTFLPLSE